MLCRKIISTLICIQFNECRFWELTSFLVCSTMMKMLCFKKKKNTPKMPTSSAPVLLQRFTFSGASRTAYQHGLATCHLLKCRTTSILAITAHDTVPQQWSPDSLSPIHFWTPWPPSRTAKGSERVLYSRSHWTQLLQEGPTSPLSECNVLIAPCFPGHEDFVPP